MDENQVIAIKYCMDKMGVGMSFQQGMEVIREILKLP